MTIYEVLKDKYIVTHPPYMGDAKEYITYQLIAQSSTLYADGSECETSVCYAVDLYTTTPPFADTISDIKTRLAGVDWSCIVENEDYEEETQFYHISMTAYAPGGIYG